jgi:hypothetical protein
VQRTVESRLLAEVKREVAASLPLQAENATDIISVLREELKRTSSQAGAAHECLDRGDALESQLQQLRSQERSFHDIMARSVSLWLSTLADPSGHSVCVSDFVACRRRWNL